MTRFFELHTSPDDFRQALRAAEAESGFTQRLIEKDYYCSLILSDLEPLFSAGLVFKGGTSLSKVHAGFFRLSEDLDFAISIPTTARPRHRRQAIASVKDHLKQLTNRLPTVGTSSPLRGHDSSRQYNASLHYESAVTGEHETVTVQVSIREPIIESTIACTGRTLLRHPAMKDVPAQAPTLRVLSLRETYAEKVRAALSRTPPAIRDAFDIDEAVRAKRLDFSESTFLALVRHKLTVLGNTPIDTSQSCRASLRHQLETDLKPVLRSADYAVFDFERAFEVLEGLAAMIRND